MAGTSDTAAPPARRRSWRYWSGALIRIVLLGLFCWYGYVRVNTPSAAAGRSGEPSAPTPEFFPPALGAALDSPALGGLPGGANFGVVWVTGTVQLGAVQDDWQPSSSTAQQALITQLARSGMNEALDQVVAQTRVWFESGEFRSAGALSNSTSSLIGRASAVARLLAERARYRVEEKNDLPGAVRDLQTALRLAGLIDARIEYYGASVLEIPMYELNCRAHETPIPLPLAQTLITTLRDELGLHLADQFGPKGVGATDASINELLDQFYTDNGHGDGWIVLSAAPTIMLAFNRPAPPAAAWNVLAPLYRSRAEMRTRLAGMRQVFAAFENEPARQIKEKVTRVLRPEPRDGPLVEVVAKTTVSDFGRAMETLIRRRAAVVLVALSAYRAAHGSNPEHLDDLVPEYLPELPLDAYTARSFIYQRKGDEFELRPALALTPDFIPYTWALVQFGYRADSYVLTRTRIQK